MTGTTAVAVWLAGALVLLGVETFTVAFVAVYVALGAVCAAIAASAGAGFGVQVIVLVAVAIGSLVLTRHWIRRALGRGPVVQSNVQTILNRHAVVTVEVPAGPGGRGQVKVGTEYWSAKHEGDVGAAIPEGTTVRILRVEGVTAVVEPVDDGG